MRGHFRHIIDDIVETVSENVSEHSYRITFSRSDFIGEEIQPLLKGSRGPGNSGHVQPAYSWGLVSRASQTLGRVGQEAPSRHL